LPAAERAAAAVYAAAPTNAYFTSTHALSLVKQGRFQEAREAFRQVTPGQLKDPTIAVYYGITLAASGLSAEAKPYLDQRSQVRLLPEEVALATRRWPAGP
jgi:predicted Zn-dependent protease